MAAFASNVGSNIVTEHERAGRSLPDMVDKHERDLYHWDGLTSRMAKTEDRVNKIEQDIIASITRREHKINLLIGGTFSAVALLVVDLIMKHI